MPFVTQSIEELQRDIGVLKQANADLSWFLFLLLEKFTDNMEVVFPPAQVRVDRELPEGLINWEFIPEEVEGVGAKVRLFWERAGS